VPPWPLQSYCQLGHWEEIGIQNAELTGENELMISDLGY
jgi:hypothetical protein